MKNAALLLTTLGLLLGSLQAQTVPSFISYQGRVTDSTGVGLGTGTPINRKVIFRIYDSATGGNRLWTEEQTTTLSAGEFSVLLGNGIAASGTAAGESRPAIDTVFTSGTTDRYIEITVDNGDNAINASDVPIAPRQRITSTAYTFRARSADTIASGTDLQLNGSSDYGLGWYGTGRLYNGIAVNGPVLYGQSGGALGSAVGATKNIALKWDASNNVTIGGTLAAGGALSGASLSVGSGTITAGNINSSGVVNAGGATMGAGGFATAGIVSAGGAITGGSLSTGSGAISGGAITGTSLSVGTGTVSAGTLVNASGPIVFGGPTNQYQALAISGGNANGYIYGSFAGYGDGIHIGYNHYKDAAGNSVGSNGADTSRISVGYGSVVLATGSSGQTPTARLSINAGGAVTVPGSITSTTGFGLGSGVPNANFKLQSKGGGTANAWEGAGAFGGTSAAAVIGQYDNKAVIGAHSAALDAWADVVINPFGGNVGIGTGTTNPPAVKLAVAGDIRASGAVVANNVYTTGNVGVNTTTPTAALEVKGSVSTNIFRWGFLANSGFNDADASSAWTLSIRAESVASASTFVVESDERIKNITGLSNGQQDLDTLQQIQITNYTLKDKVAKGAQKYKKVIAQQVEKVYPLAVSRTTDVVPDIYKMAPIQDGWVSLTTDLKKGDRVRLIADKTQGVHEVLEVAQGRFRTAFKPEGKDIFVYGREVKDFRVVDYEAISMLNVSATQQLKKEKDAEVKALQTENADLRARLDALEAKDKARDRKLAAIEALLGEDKPAVRTVKLKQASEAQ